MPKQVMNMIISIKYAISEAGWQYTKFITWCQIEKLKKNSYLVLFHHWLGFPGGSGG